MSQFDNCISLGWYCGTALSMTYNGLRSCSGPFDWNFSDLDAVLKLMETDFLDFMLKENLEVSKEKQKVFFDKKYGFYYPHEIKVDFEQEYLEIAEKYHRRAERFMEMIKRPTCFIRVVRSEDEISYIKRNKNYIFNVIKKRNNSNEIIFLLPKKTEDLQDDVIYFRLNTEYYRVSSYDEMPRIFSLSKEFIKFCYKNFIPEETMKKNSLREEIIQLRSLVIHKIIERSNNSVALALRTYFSTIEEGIYLWGAGYNGNSLLIYMINEGIKVNGIIDNSDKKQGTMLNGFTIISFSELEQDDINILVTLSAKQEADSVMEQINNRFSNATILLWNNLYQYL